VDLPERDTNNDQATPFERAVSGGLVIGAGATHGVPGAMLAASALPYAEMFIHRAFSEFKPDAKRRVDDMLTSADETLGWTGPGFLADLTGKSEQTRLLTNVAADAAARTAWPLKAAALGRVLAAGLIAEDEAEIDLQHLALAAMADLERPHISLLELLVRWQPPSTDAECPYVARRPGEHRYWDEADVVAVRRELGPALGVILGTLTRHGLAVRNMTDFPTPHLLATPHGERLLGFYELAADRSALGSAPA
jgi:hypothetical protein